jgi:hypothetical protein
MVRVPSKHLSGEVVPPSEKQGSAVSVAMLGKEVLVLCSAISGPYAFAEAREGVNQLFLHDYEYAPELRQDRLGPMHMVACPRSATEGKRFVSSAFLIRLWCQPLWSLRRRQNSEDTAASVSLELPGSNDDDVPGPTLIGLD